MNDYLSRSRLLPLLISACLVWSLAACSSAATAQPALTKDQAVDAAWQALEPNTSSHDMSNWEVVEADIVTGGDVADEFSGEPAPGCLGPEPPANAAIAPLGQYWRVLMQPRKVTPVPVPTERYSPTAPPAIPEPFTREARFLIDLAGGGVVARSLSCVIY